MSVRIAKAQVYKAEDGWRWRTLGGNGETLASGEAYVRKIDAIATLTAHLPEDTEIEEIDNSQEVRTIRASDSIGLGES